jgi:hypothetical protein
MSQGDEFVRRNQGFAVDMTFALLVWLFSVFVFLPLGDLYVSPELYSLLAFIFLVVFGYYFISALRSSNPLFEYVSNRVTSWYMGWRGIDDNEKPVIWGRVKKSLKICFILVAYLGFRPLLWVINPVFAGVAFIIVLIQVFRILTNKYL